MALKEAPLREAAGETRTGEAGLSLRAGAVHVHIGALELRGFPAARRYAIAEACQRELVRLFEQDPRVGALPRAPAAGLAAPASIDADAQPELIGSAIAHAVAKRLR